MNITKANPFNLLMLLGLSFLLSGCGAEQSPPATDKTADETKQALTLSDAEVENIVKRSFQYVAMYNVNNKVVMDPALPIRTGGWNKTTSLLQLMDHTVKIIARPNNDTFYAASMLDLTREPVILETPALDSKYASLMVTPYDHYVNVPLTSRRNEFAKPTRVLFYSQRTPAFDQQSLTGIDKVVEVTGDYAMMTYRVMPHSRDPQRTARIRAAMQGIKAVPLSEYLGGERLPATALSEFPAFGKTEEDVFENNLLEVMQFVFNHTTFDPDNEIDNGVLAAYKPLGVVPGQKFDACKVATIDGKRFRRVAETVRQQVKAKLEDKYYVAKMMPTVFQAKGQISLEALVLQSVVGPSGQPPQEAVYRQPIMADGEPMSALNDYVLHMSKEELPPANAFWSLTLYDGENGFFIPNDRKKYSVGENAGMKLNDEGGISIYVAAEKPEGVPEENWLPVNRGDYVIDLMTRLYAPDLERYKEWTPPQVEMLH